MTYTRVGQHVLRWPPYRALSQATKLFWLSLYVGDGRAITGLWTCGIGALCDLTGFDRHETVAALDELLAHELIEFDVAHDVLRLTKLPDAAEWPVNGSTVTAWWRRFLDVPCCAVRDAHARTVRWLIEEGTRVRAQREGKENAVSEDHESAWGKTFGTVPPPSKRHHGVKRMLNDDTSTAVQPSLFAIPVVDMTTPSVVAHTHSPGVEHPGERERACVSVPDLGSGSSLSQAPDLSVAADRHLDLPEHTPPPGPPPAAPTTTPKPWCGVSPDPDVATRIQLVHRIWDMLNERRAALAREFGLDPPRHLHDQLPGRTALAARLRESGPRAYDDAAHVLAIAEVEARAQRSLKWFAGSMFEPKSWAHKLSMSIDDAKRDVRDRNLEDVLDDVFGPKSTPPKGGLFS